MEVAVTLIVVVLNLTLAVLALTRTNRTKTILWFSSFVVLLSVWSIGNYYSISSTTPLATIFWIRFVLQITLFLGISLFLFVNYYPQNLDFVNNRIKLIFIVYPFLFSPFIWTKLTIEDVKVSDNNISPLFGPGMLFYALYLVSILITSIYILVKKYTKVSGTEKLKVGYLFYGIGLTTILALITNLIFVTILKVSDFVVFGPFFSLIFVSTSFYSIIKHRFLDIRFLLGKLTYYLLLAVLPYSVFYLITLINTSIFGTIYSSGSYIVGVFFALIFVVFFNSANNFIRKSIDSKLINPGYDPFETVDDLSNQLAIDLDILKISETTLSTISRTIRPSFESILIIPREKNSKPFLIDYREYKSAYSPRDITIALEIWKISGKEPIVYDEIQQELFTRYSQEQKEIHKLRMIMEKYQIKVLVPLGQNEEISGILILGQKEADSPYTVQDIDFLKSLASATRVAVERALFYSEVVDLNRNLQKRVEEATKELQIKNTDLQNALDVIKEVQRRERDMIDIMGHELRTPITIVRNALSLLNLGIEKNKGVPFEILSKYIKMAAESAEREVTLIETLLSATKVDAQRLQLFRENVDFKDVVKDSIFALRSKAQPKDLEIRYKEPEKLPEAYADRTRIQEVVDNLLSNAIKYTEKGHIDITLEQKGNFIVCSVKDTGYGIPAKDLKNLGKKFYRVQSHTNNDSAVVRPGGTGLGLYVTFEIVKRHGGEMNVTSEVGKGSNFSFTVPIFKNQKIEKPHAAREKDLFKRLGKKTQAEEEKDNGKEKKKPLKKATQREIAD